MNATTGVVRETERKYEMDETTRFPDPAGPLGLRLLGEPQDQHLEATYFDTADLRLLRAKLILRRREGGHDEGWHLKLPAGADSRDEVRLPLSESAGGPPTGLVELTRVHTRGAELGPVAALLTDRKRWVLGDGAGRTLVEVVDDHVRARWVGRPRRARGARSRSSWLNTAAPKCWARSNDG